MAQARQSYAGSGIGAAQQDAVARIREMQDRARQNGVPANPAFRNWSTNPNMRRRTSAHHRQEEAYPPPPAPPIDDPPPQQPEPPVAPPNANRQVGQGQNYQRRRRQAPPHAHQADYTSPPRQESGPAAQEKPKDTTLLQDILGGIGLDDDRVLILGLVLILINSKADATLILALLYLLL